MTKFAAFMTRDTKWNLPVWGAGLLSVVLASGVFLNNVINFVAH